MQKLLVAMPLYTHVSVAWFLRFLEMKKEPIVHYLATRKIYLERSMQEMFTGSLEYDWDRLVVYEGDMQPPRDAFLRISQYPDTPDIVGSVYFYKEPPYAPIIYMEAAGQGRVCYHPLSHQRVRAMLDAPGLYPVDAVGMGLTSIHRRVIEKWDPDIPMFGGNTLELGHDMLFCHRAKEQGFSVHVDSGIECAHLGELGVTSAITAARKENDNG